MKELLKKKESCVGPSLSETLGEKFIPFLKSLRPVRGTLESVSDHKSIICIHVTFYHEDNPEFNFLWENSMKDITWIHFNRLSNLTGLDLTIEK